MAPAGRSQERQPESLCLSPKAAAAYSKAYEAAWHKDQQVGRWEDVNVQGKSPQGPQASWQLLLLH